MIFGHLAGRARTLFLSHVCGDMLYARLSPQNPAATARIFFVKIGGDIWCYVFQYICVNGRLRTQRGQNSGRGF